MWPREASSLRGAGTFQASTPRTRARGFFSSGDTCRRASEDFCDVAEIRYRMRPSEPAVGTTGPLIWRESSLPTVASVDSVAEWRQPYKYCVTEK